MTHLSDVTTIAWFKREVALPGRFSILYPEATNDLVVGQLADGFWKARLDGWMPGVTATADTAETTPDISMTAVAIVIVYAGMNFVRNELKNLVTKTTYRAPGGLENTTERSANVLTEILKMIEAERTQLLDRAMRGGGRGLPIFMHDGYAIRVENLYTPERMVAFQRSALELL